MRKYFAVPYFSTFTPERVTALDREENGRWMENIGSQVYGDCTRSNSLNEPHICSVKPVTSIEQ